MKFSTQISSNKIEVSTAKEQAANYDNKDTIKPKDMTYETQLLEEIARNLDYQINRKLVSININTSTRFVHDICGRRNVTSSTLEIMLLETNFDGRPVWVFVLSAISGTLSALGIENFISFSES